MLQRIVIQNIALIDEAAVEFTPGLNVLTGETGAGKSILIDALNLVLGVRADRELIAADSQKAVVEATFLDDAGACNELLEELGIEREETLTLSRELYVNGRNICRINGTLVNNISLQQLSALLIDIHGQHEHQSLFNAQLHISLLDAFGGKEIAAEKEKMQKDLFQLRQCMRELNNFGADGGERERRLDILRYQLQEITSAKLQTDEDTHLVHQRLLINNARHIAEVFALIDHHLHGHEQTGALDALRIICHELHSIASFDSTYEQLAGQCDEAFFTLESIADSFHRIYAGLNFDPVQAEEVGRRLDEIQTLKRKYGGSIDAVLKMGFAIEEEILRLENAQERIGTLEEQKAQLLLQLYRQCLCLHELRTQAAEKFQNLVMRELQDLGMNRVRFAVSFAPIPEQASEDEKPYTQHGLDHVEFMLSANPGQPLRPLSRIASGGEASRIMLALKNIAAQLDGIDCLIFDEIDSGLSGEMAHVVALKMASISRGRQVLCVTHLAQLASMADTHFLIEKHVGQSTTTTTVLHLDDQAHAFEVARLLGGKGEGGHGLAHAVEMISRAKSIKVSIS